MPIFVILYLAFGVAFQAIFYGGGSFADVWTWFHILFWFWIMLFWFGVWCVVIVAVGMMVWWIYETLIVN